MLKKGTDFKKPHEMTMADVQPAKEEEEGEPVVGEKGNASPDPKDYDKFIN